MISGDNSANYLVDRLYVNWEPFCGPSWSGLCRSVQLPGSAVWWCPPAETGECWCPPADQVGAQCQAVNSSWSLTVTEQFSLCPTKVDTYEEQLCFTLKSLKSFKVTLIRVSGVMSFSSLWVEAVWEGETWLVFPCLKESAFESFSRGRVFLKMLTMRRLMGNMMTELWTPIITCCQVNSMWPAKKVSSWCSEV